MVAAVAGREDMGVMLAKRFPECIPVQNKVGLDAVRLSLSVSFTPCLCKANWCSSSCYHVNPAPARCT
jgi:hypothetical protein